MGRELTKVVVDLGPRSYPIVIGKNILETSIDAEFLSSKIRGENVCIITNETVAPLYLDTLKKNLSEFKCSHIVLPDGERYKTMDSIQRIMTVLLEQRQNRTLTLIALGGGVIGDMTGFAAACYQRGVDFIQVPTTLLAQVDSSVGGKTGVNHPLGKNMIGAFKQPTSVIIDTATLTTLPDREFNAGMAEVIKYGLIWDASFFHWIEDNVEPLKNRDSDALAYAIAKSCEIKAIVVAEDETEQGIRATLNLGHTFGHAIETHTGYGNWLHGEAVATGMLMAVAMSENDVEASTFARLQLLTEQFDLPVRPPKGMNQHHFIQHMSVDKKNVDESIRLVLLKKLGKAYVTSDYSKQLLSQVFQQFVQ